MRSKFGSKGKKYADICLLSNLDEVSADRVSDNTDRTGNESTNQKLRYSVNEPIDMKSVIAENKQSA